MVETPRLIDNSILTLIAPGDHPVRHQRLKNQIWIVYIDQKYIHLFLLLLKHLTIALILMVACQTIMILLRLFLPSPPFILHHLIKPSLIYHVLQIVAVVREVVAVLDPLQTSIATSLVDVFPEMTFTTSPENMPPVAEKIAVDLSHHHSSIDMSQGRHHSLLFELTNFLLHFLLISRSGSIGSQSGGE